MKRWGEQGGTAALLAVLLVCAAVLRLGHINWDEFQHVHPDERFIVWVADTVRWPGDLAAALDPARSPLDPFRWPAGANELAGKPRNYAYGHFPLYLLVAVAHAAAAVGDWFGRTTIAFPPAFQPIHTIGRHLAEYNYLTLVGRAISALADLGTLLLVYALGRQLAARNSQHVTVTGLLAAAMYAFAVLPIQLSHFAAVDALLTFFVAATVALAARWAERPAVALGLAASPAGAGRLRNGSRDFESPGAGSHPTSGRRGGGWGTWIAAGVFAGLAVGTKFSAVLLAVPLCVAALYHLPAAPWRRKLLVVLGRLAAAAAAGLAAFLVTNPFAIIEFDAYVGQILAQNAMVSGAMDAPYTRQYIGRLPYLYFVQQLSQWGLGWPLGAVTWGGFVWAIISAARRRAGPALVVMLAWALPYFALTGAFHTQFLRYMAPLLPFLVVFGAAAALAGYRWLSARWGRRGRAAWAVLAAGTAVFTLGWALAFTGVYRQEHPWIAASRWIYSNIPEGKKLLTEHWDDALPLALDELTGKPPSRNYQRVELPLWDPDTPEKLDALVNELSTADYIVLASNRLYAPMARLRGRYPMTSQYYRLLFSGDLGYRSVAEFSAYPGIGGLTIRDDNADESFTVYDHPRVMVFENTGRLKAELLRARLGRYLPANVQRSTSTVHRVPGLARYRPQTPTPNAPASDAPLTLSQPVDTLPVVADFRWNGAASASTPLAVLLWWLALSLLGWLAWPLLFPLLGGLRDRGYGVARVAGWLLVGWVHWLAVSLGLWQNRAGAIAAVVAALAMAGLAAWIIQRKRLAAFWAERRRLLLGEEALFAAAYLAFVGVRLLDPDLWQPWNGGEKFMEFAFLNAILRSPHFPPYDPYFAGGIINYYYYGLYLVSLLVKLTGIASEVAFNLAVPGLFALTALGLFSGAYNLAAGFGLGSAREQGSGGTGEQGSGGAGERGGAGAGGRVSADSPLRPSAAAAGALAVLLGLLMGNLRGAGWLPAAWKSVVTGSRLPQYDYWAASRVIPNTINEFPLWTFVFADLHPHMIAMPFGLLVVGLALNWVVGQRSEVRGQGSGIRGNADAGGTQSVRAPTHHPFLVCLSTCLLIALALGALGAINTWDLPTYALLVAGAFGLAGWRARRWRGAVGSAALAGAVIVLAVAAYWPFYTHYQAQVGDGAGPLVARFLGWVHAASPLTEWLTIWGFFLFLAVVYVTVMWQQRGAGEQGSGGAGEQGSGGAGEQGSGGAGEQGSEGAGEPGSGGAGERGSGEDEPVSLSVASTDQSVPPYAHTPTLPRDRRRLVALLVFFGALALLAAAGRPTAALAALPLCLALPLAFRRGASAGEAFLGLLLALGLGVIAGTELVYLRDFLEGGDWYRMNTLFKFSVPAWLLLGLAGGVMLPVVWAALRRAPGWLALSVRAVLVAWLGAGLVFLVAGVRARVDDRFPGARPALGTLDGAAYMTVGSYTWPSAEHVISLAPEREAIRWLLDNVAGTPVIAEAPAGGYVVDGASVGYDYYRAGGLRVASLTGFPTFLGQHQYEQRPGDQVGARFEQGKEFFATADSARARELMRDLHVGYVYVGALERLLFAPESLRKFDVMAELGDLAVVYRNPEVTIYRVETRDE